MKPQIALNEQVQDILSSRVITYPLSTDYLANLICRYDVHIKIGKVWFYLTSHGRDIDNKVKDLAKIKRWMNSGKYKEHVKRKVLAYRIVESSTANVIYQTNTK